MLSNLAEDIILYGDTASYIIFITALLATILVLFYYLRLVSYVLVGPASAWRLRYSMGDIVWASPAFWQKFTAVRITQVTAALFLLCSMALVPLLITFITQFVF